MRAAGRRRRRVGVRARGSVATFARGIARAYNGRACTTGTARVCSTSSSSWPGAAAGGLGGSVCWSAIVLVLMATLAAIGGYLLLMGTPTTLAAAQIEGGYRPNLQRWSRRGRRVPNQYQVTGHLADGELSSFSQGARHLALRPARLRARATPTSARASITRRRRRSTARSRADNRFVGRAVFADGQFPGTCPPRGDRVRRAVRALLADRRRVPARVPGERAVAARHRRRRGRARADRRS